MVKSLATLRFIIGNSLNFQFEFFTCKTEYIQAETCCEDSPSKAVITTEVCLTGILFSHSFINCFKINEKNILKREREIKAGKLTSLPQAMEVTIVRGCGESLYHWFLPTGQYMTHVNFLYTVL